MKDVQMASWKAEIIDYVSGIEDPYWVKYILQLVHMIWVSSEEPYPETEEYEDPDYDY